MRSAGRHDSIAAAMDLAMVRARHKAGARLRAGLGIDLLLR
jgi:hypothetical protein